jgi:Fuc2NAc and GlcNAc transferase
MMSDSIFYNFSVDRVATNISYLIQVPSYFYGSQNGGMWANSSFSLLTSLFTVKLIERQFGRKLLAIPNDRSSHSQPTPTSGGLGFILVFLFASLAYAYQAGSLVETTRWWLMLTPLVIVGVCDDIWSLPSTWRYLVQLFTATIAVLYFDPFPQPWLDAYGNIGHGIAILLTIIGMTAIINFYNFMDGLDGLVGSVAAIQIAFIAFYTHQPILWLLVAALCGFVYWNWAPAKIFMGDAGSTFLGAIISMSLLNQHQGAIGSWSTFAITMPIIADASYTIIRRLLNRENIFRAHRSHLYQRLQQSGLPHSTVAGIYILMTVAIAALILNYSYAGAIASAIGAIGSIGVGEVYLQTVVKNQNIRSHR